MIADTKEDHENQNKANLPIAWPLSILRFGQLWNHEAGDPPGI